MAAVLRRFCRSKVGATAIEYGLIAALIAMVIIVSLNQFANQNNRIYDYVHTSVTGAVGDVER